MPSKPKNVSNPKAIIALFKLGLGFLCHAIKSATNSFAGTTGG